MDDGRAAVYLIAGLGNPGPDYRHTRHNLGSDVLEDLAGSLGVQWSGRMFKSLSARGFYQGKSLVLLRPETYMNLSGEAVRACAHYYGASPEAVLVVHDDLDLPLGRVRVARGGGAGGHKGVSSVIQHLGTRDFPRVRLGIGRPPERVPVEKYVLSPFTGNERELVPKVVQWGARACEVFVAEGPEAAMNLINGVDLTA